MGARTQESCQACETIWDFNRPGGRRQIIRATDTCTGPTATNYLRGKRRKGTVKTANKEAAKRSELRMRSIRGVTKQERLIFTLDRKGATSGTVTGAMAFDRKDYGMNKGIPFIKIADRVEVDRPCTQVAAPQWAPRQSQVATQTDTPGGYDAPSCLQARRT